jgi:hypothetical protein
VRNVGLCLVALCLGMTAGCKTPPKPGSNGGSTDRPFLPRSDGSSSAIDTSPAPGRVDGLLAGQVVDKFNRRIPEAAIQVVDLQDLTVSNKAALEVYSDKQGYFTIQGLQAGRTYRLTARIAEGRRLLSGTTLATPPNPRLSIYVSEDFTTPNTPPIPEAPGAADKKGQPEKDKTASTPPAALEPPVKTGADPTPRPGTTAAPTTPIDKSQIADGFQRGPKTPGIPYSDRAVGSIPGAGTGEQPKVPPPPGSPTVDAVPRPAPVSPGTTTGPGPSASIPQGPMRVPDCVLIGKQLDKLALYDLDGEPWDYRRDKKGRVVLLSFWQSANSLPLVPHLVKMQNDYKAAGLEVVGISYEPGSDEQQRLVVRGTRMRHSINYKLLLGGGPFDRCPVAREFEIDQVPALVLLDEKGKIVWKSTGMIDERQLKELRKLIAQSLGSQEP